MLFLTVEVAFFGANIAKVEHGAWLPLVIVAALLSIVMINWRRGQTIVTRNRVAQEGRLHEFLEGLDSRAEAAGSHARRRGLPMPRQGHHSAVAPRRRRGTHTLPEKVVIVSVDTVSIPHVETFDRCAVEVLGHGRFKIVHLTARFGYHDKLSIPERAGRGAQARAARAQPRPRARLLLRLADHDHADRRSGGCGGGKRTCSSRWP